LASLETTEPWFCVIGVEESTNVVDAAARTWTTVTSSPDTSPRETPRAAAVCDDRPDRIEAVVVAVDVKNQRGNGIVLCSCHQ